MGPCWVAENKNKLYTAPKKERIPTNIAAPPNQVIEERKIKISPPRLALGGAAIFVILNKNHQRPMMGAILKELRIKIILRLLRRVYTIPTKLNIPEEHSPCATIITTAPATLKKVSKANPKITKAMCATEEYATKDLASV